MANPGLPNPLIEETEAGGVSQPNVALTRRFGGGKTTEAKVVEANTTLATPATGKAITLYWVGVVAPEGNTGEVKVTVKLGSLEPYIWFLGKQGSFAHWEPVKGAVNAALTVELSAAQKVAVNFTYTES